MNLPSFGFRNGFVDFARVGVERSKVALIYWEEMLAGTALKTVNERAEPGLSLVFGGPSSQRR